jgi:V8-like Glu-specific endopeptidase
MGKARFAVLGVVALSWVYGAAQISAIGKPVRAEDLSHPLAAPLSPDHPAAQADPGWLTARPMPLRERNAHPGPLRSHTVEFDFETGRPRHVLESLFLDPASNVSEGYAGATPQPPSTGGTKDWHIVIGTDGRRRVENAGLFPWRTIAKLRMRFNGQDYIGSGILIANKYVLTAGHNVYDRTLGGYADRIEVIPGMTGTFAPYGKAIAKRMRTFSGWTNNESSAWDMALITLDREIGKSTGYLGYANYDNAQLNRAYVTIAGYPFDRDNGTRMWFMSGLLLRRYPHELNYSIDTAGGQSGSGIWRVVNGKRYVIGVHAYGVSANPPYNGGTRIEATKFNAIKNWIASGS